MLFQLCVILEPMQELMSRHKAYALSPRDCLKTTLFQKWQRMVAPPGNMSDAINIAGIAFDRSLIGTWAHDGFNWFCVQNRHDPSQRGGSARARRPSRPGRVVGRLRRRARSGHPDQVSRSLLRTWWWWASHHWWAASSGMRTSGSSRGWRIVSTMPPRHWTLNLLVRTLQFPVPGRTHGRQLRTDRHTETRLPLKKAIRNHLRLANRERHS